MESLEFIFQSPAFKKEENGLDENEEIKKVSGGKVNENIFNTGQTLKKAKINDDLKVHTLFNTINSNQKVHNNDEEKPDMTNVEDKAISQQAAKQLEIVQEIHLHSNN